MEQDNRCTLPWDGRVRILIHKNSASACCKTPMYSIGTESGILTPEMVELRKDILSNKRSEQCSDCWKVEDLGGPSYRRSHSTHYRRTINWDELDPYEPVQDIEVVFSNKCQMMCVYCSPDISSMWDDHEFKISGRRIEINPQVPKLEDVVDVSKLRTISVSGGEPLMDEKCIQFFLDLPYDPERKLSLVTNLSVGDAAFESLMKIIEKHRNFFVVCSLDSVGENVNRKYLNWDRWKINFERLVDDVQSRLKFKYSGLMINITVTSLSYKDVQGVIEYIIRLKKKGKKGILFRINPINLSQPLSLASARLDANFSVKLSDEDMQFLNNSEKDMIREYNTLISNVEYNEELDKASALFLERYFKELVK